MAQPVRSVSKPEFVIRLVFAEPTVIALVAFPLRAFVAVNVTL